MSSNFKKRTDSKLIREVIKQPFVQKTFHRNYKRRFLIETERIEDFIYFKGFFCKDILRKTVSSQKKRFFGRSDKNWQAGKTINQSVKRGQ